MKILISLITLAIITVLLSFNSKHVETSNQENYSYQSPENDTIKIKLTQKLKLVTHKADQKKIIELINLNDTISNIKPDYSNVKSVEILKSYKKRLADNVPNYKRLNVMDAFVFNIRSVFNHINLMELKIAKEEAIQAKYEAIKVKREEELMRHKVIQGAKFLEASKFYNSILKKESISEADVIKFKTNYPVYANQKAKGSDKTWLELLEETAK